MTVGPPETIPLVGLLPVMTDPLLKLCFVVVMAAGKAQSVAKGKVFGCLQKRVTGKTLQLVITSLQYSFVAKTEYPVRMLLAVVSVGHLLEKTIVLENLQFRSWILGFAALT